MRGRIVQFVVDTHDDGDVFVRGRGGDDDLLGACIKVLLCACGLGEEAGGLDDDVNVELAPGEVGRIALGEHLDGFAANNQVAVNNLNACGQAAGHGVVLEQVRQGLGAGQVVYGNNFNVCTLCQSGAEVVTANAAEPVDTNTSSHFFSLLGAQMNTRRQVEGHLQPLFPARRWAEIFSGTPIKACAVIHITFYGARPVNLPERASIIWSGRSVAADWPYGRISEVACLRAASKRLDTSAQLTRFQKALT